MKNLTDKSSARWLAAFSVVGAGFMMTCLPVVAADEEKKDNNGFLNKMEQWQEKMSEKFRDTWKGLRGDAKEKSVATASVDLREDKDRYILRLNLPDRDLGKVELALEGETLRIVAPAGERGGPYEQTVALAGVEPGAEPKVERRQKDSMIIVTVPKSAHVEGRKPSLTLPDPALTPLSEWDRDIFERMEKMRRDMDRDFEDAFHEFRGKSGYEGFFDEPRFGSSLDLKEEGDNYVVRAYLPGRDVQNISVTAHDRTLTIEAKEEKTTKEEDKVSPLHSTRKAAYSQILTLPGPIQSDKMNVEKKENMLIVTLPKAR